MVTLITEGDNTGTHRRCDAHCYNATDDKCVCVCEGRNHGKGLQTAAANTAMISKEILEAAQQTGRKIIVHEQVRQMELFTR